MEDIDQHDYECQLAMLQGIENQAKKTANALARVLGLLDEIAIKSAKKKKGKRNA